MTTKKVRVIWARHRLPVPVSIKSYDRVENLQFLAVSASSRKDHSNRLFDGHLCGSLVDFFSLKSLDFLLPSVFSLVLQIILLEVFGYLLLFGICQNLLLEVSGCFRHRLPTFDWVCTGDNAECTSRSTKSKQRIIFFAFLLFFRCSHNPQLKNFKTPEKYMFPVDTVVIQPRFALLVKMLVILSFSSVWLWPQQLLYGIFQASEFSGWKRDSIVDWTKEP